STLHALRARRDRSGLAHAHRPAMELDGGTAAGARPHGRGRLCGQPVVSHLGDGGYEYDPTVAVREPGRLPGRRSSADDPEEPRPAGNRLRPGGKAYEPACRLGPGLVRFRTTHL